MWEMLREIDELDRALEQRIKERPGICITEVIKPFLMQRSETVLRQRIRGLALRDLIKLTPTKKEVLAYPKEE
jgi:hypothetical protein